MPTRTYTHTRTQHTHTHTNTNRHAHAGARYYEPSPTDPRVPALHKRKPLSPRSKPTLQAEPLSHPKQQHPGSIGVSDDLHSFKGQSNRSTPVPFLPSIQKHNSMHDEISGLGAKTLTLEELPGSLAHHVMEPSLEKEEEQQVLHF